MKYFAYLIIIIVVVAVVAGFFVVGSPFQERARRFDERRVQDLQTIQSEIVSYWSNKSSLPESLSELEDSIRGFTPAKDPETNKDYEYQVKSDLSFALCANFNLESMSETNYPKAPYDYYSSQQNWQHDAGHFCFERSIDPEIYGPKNRIP